MGATLTRMSRSLVLTTLQARAFARRAVLLDQRVASPDLALSHLGYIQLDPLNVCGRMHDLILRNRVQSYREDDLLNAIHGRTSPVSGHHSLRQGFEHYIPGAGILAAWPWEAYPYVRAYLHRIHPTTTWRKLTSDEGVVAKKILEEISERGPLTSDDLEHEGRGETPWGTSGRLVKIVLEKLFASGDLLITARRGFRRVYDLASRIRPALAAKDLPDDRALQRWLALTRVKQRRLANLRKIDVALLGDAVHPIKIENGPTVYCLKEDVGLAENAQSNAPSSDPLLLAPLDPIIYDRKLTQTLWDFDFTWEVYTPPQLRKRGYYSLPILAGLDLVGDVEPRADRKRRRLTVVSRRVKRGYDIKNAVAELARFLGVRR